MMNASQESGSACIGKPGPVRAMFTDCLLTLLLSTFSGHLHCASSFLPSCIQMTDTVFALGFALVCYYRLDSKSDLSSVMSPDQEDAYCTWAGTGPSVRMMTVLQEFPSPEKPGAAIVSTGARKATLATSGARLLMIGSLTWTDTLIIGCWAVGAWEFQLL